MWTNQDRDSAINKGIAGEQLTDHEVHKLEEAVRVGNRSSDAREALERRGRR